jgi:hypothetical protein
MLDKKTLLTTPFLLPSPCISNRNIPRNPSTYTYCIHTKYLQLLPGPNSFNPDDGSSMFLRNSDATLNTTWCQNSEGYQYEWSMLSKSLRSEHVPYHIPLGSQKHILRFGLHAPQGSLRILTVAVAKCENSKHFLSQEFLYLNCIKQHASCETHHKTCCHDSKHGYGTRTSGVKFRSLLKKGFQFGKRNNAGEWMEILAQILIPVYITTWFRGSLSLTVKYLWSSWEEDKSVLYKFRRTLLLQCSKPHFRNDVQNLINWFRILTEHRTPLMYKRNAPFHLSKILCKHYVVLGPENYSWL